MGSSRSDLLLRKVKDDRSNERHVDIMPRHSSDLQPGLLIRRPVFDFLKVLDSRVAGLYIGMWNQSRPLAGSTGIKGGTDL